MCIMCVCVCVCVCRCYMVYNNNAFSLYGLQQQCICKCILDTGSSIGLPVRTIPLFL